jgi:putative membrane protein
MGFWGWTMMVTLWGGVAALVVWAVRSTGVNRGGGTGSALDILERRFASGEIDREEYEERRRLLGLGR